MIPVRLELKNFMSYGTQVMPLEFTGVHLACLSGDNGNGKSALLDAITWALWGEARAPADQLVRLGTDEMRVIFDFHLEGTTYRVIRGRSKRSAGNLWEIFVADESGGFRSITGQGIRDTGRVIQKILRMDYRTFINSAYIQQGRADEFTKQTVSDRKKILADILDLSRYDTLETRAKELRNGADSRAQELKRDIERAEIELKGEEDCKTRLAEAKTERDTLETGIKEAEEQLRELQARQGEMDAAVRRVREMEAQIAGWKSEMTNLQSQKSEQELRVASAREIIRDRERILSGHEKLASVRASVALSESRLSELRTVEHELSGLKQAIMTERHKLDIERQSLAKELAELETKVSGSEAVRKDAEALRARVAELDKLEERRAQLQREMTEQADRLGLLKARYDQAVDLKTELDKKLEMISLPGAECPLCKTELGDMKHENLLADYRRQIADAEKQAADLKSEGTNARKKRDSAQKEIDQADEQLKAGLEVRRRLAQAEQVLFAAEEYGKQLPDVRSRLDAVNARLNSDDFAQDYRAKAKQAANRIAALSYNPEEHKRLKEELSGLEQFESLAVKLRHSEENMAADEANLKAIAELISSREKSVEDCRRSVEDIGRTLDALPQITAQTTQVSASLAGLREQDRRVTGAIATLESTLDRCKALRKETVGKRKDQEKAQKDKRAYEELVGAFGKKGVQALIIENAIPEIQEEANNLLARMTDNAMQVSIETVRDKKTGGTAETLDIRISDDMGTRSYELFSGGEAFRVNFALRIALSKLLARRAGAALQTLIIDEGFGTQDGKGREKLVEAINSIKEDFELILVITHIDELKDAFPTRIEITKDNSGSQIAVN